MTKHHTPELDLSRYDLVTASEKLFEYVCNKARAWGADPRIECAYITPRHPLAQELGPYYRVMWESGSFNWGIDLSLNGGVTFMELDAPYDGLRPAVTMGEPADWYLEPHYWFDVGFVPRKGTYWNVDAGDNETFPSIIEVTGSAARKLLAKLDRQPELLKDVNRRLFEELIAEVFHGFGYQVELTRQTRDGGKDIIAVKTIDTIRLRYLIECKRPNRGKAIGVSTVRELLGVSVDDPASKALLVTTTSFTDDARKLIDRHQWNLEGKDYQDVVDWVSTYNRIRS